MAKAEEIQEGSQHRLVREMLLGATITNVTHSIRQQDGVDTLVLTVSKGDARGLIHATVEIEAHRDNPVLDLRMPTFRVGL